MKYQQTFADIALITIIFLFGYFTKSLVSSSQAKFNFVNSSTSSCPFHNICLTLDNGRIIAIPTTDYNHLLDGTLRGMANSQWSIIRRGAIDTLNDSRFQVFLDVYDNNSRLIQTLSPTVSR